MKETDLYDPLKRFLEAQQYEVKGEVRDCDVMAVRGDEDPVIVELKLSLNLGVVLQAVERLALSSSVYVGVPSSCKAVRNKPKQIIKMLRMLGLGLLQIDPNKTSNAVQVLLDPGPYKPRESKQRKARLLKEFDKRVGDPNKGGSEKRRGIMTAYRQQALLVAATLLELGPTRAAEVVRILDLPKARSILSSDFYGWFDRISRGIYTLSPRGKKELALWQQDSDAKQP